MAYIVFTFHCCHLFIFINLEQGELNAVGNTEWGYRPYEIIRQQGTAGTKILVDSLLIYLMPPVLIKIFSQLQIQ